MNKADKRTGYFIAACFMFAAAFIFITAETNLHVFVSMALTFVSAFLFAAITERL